MNPVLLATDGSPTAGKASDTAIEFAQLLGTELVVVCVWDIAYTTVGLAPLPITARAEDAGVQARAVVLRGQPVGQICRAAETYAPHFLHRLARLGSAEASAVRERVDGRAPSRDVPRGRRAR